MDMKQSFNHFAIQFLSAILLGLLLVALHSRILGGFFAIFVPKFASPWELSKLIYWPMLGSVLFTQQAKTSAWEPGRAAACLVLTPMALFLLCWCLSLLNLSSGVYVLLWILVMASGMLAATMGDADRKLSPVWLVLAVALGMLYVIFSYMPPQWGPFLDPTDVAAMARIPY